MSVALVTDSTAYLTPQLAAELGVRVVPLHVTLGDWSFDEPDVDAAEFYRRLRGGDAKPTTSQPSPGEFLAAFTAAADEGAHEILCITCTAGMSGTHQSARLAARMAPLPIEVIDSGTISGGLLLTVGSVARAVAAGATFADAVLLAKSMAGRVWSTWSADTTALMRAGGRLSDDVPEGVTILGLEDGVRVLGAARSVEESVQLQAATILAAAASTPTRITVGHGDVPELADALEQALVGKPGVLGIDRYVVGPVVGAHAGPGNFGASYLVGG
ncbi:MAG: DegV family protein [Actinobacteria bacterium]|nr:DegV family protein [Actinomycetota bacterium]MCA1722435.1 DegV family protein [Actinomycetota bacterium]